MQAVTAVPAMIFDRAMLPSTLSTLTSGSDGASASSWLARMYARDEGVGFGQAGPSVSSSHYHSKLGSACPAPFL